MSAYREKNVVDAVQFTSPNDTLVTGINIAGAWVQITSSDWIVTDAGVVSVVKNADFSAKYEPAA